EFLVKKKSFYIFLRPLAAVVLMGCAGQAEQVEVTRLVPEQIPVTVEVTRVFVQEIVQEVAVEVTRIVEVAPVIEATAEPTMESAAEAEPSPTPEPTATTAETGVTYTVQPGDTLATIADQTGTTIAALQAANNMDGSSFLIAGQDIIIPGLEGEVPVIEAPAPAPTEAPVESAPVVAATSGTNLLPNPSFEGNWHFYLYNELQIPDGWQLATDEGANNLEQGAGGLFNRPEVRVVPAKDLPPAEHSLFIFDGDKTVKAFKGGAPTSFSMFTDVALQPDSYRLTINFFPDTVTGYDDNRQKIYASDPLAAEARVIVDGGGTGWQGTASGQRNTLTYDFTIDEARTVRVGGAFRNRYIMANNGWFLDNWSLTQLDTGQ
ncbi:MAG: LysM peptidoglycan-binding domain-containing protein, partial [Candidatus Promineifilaceae bacterium]